MPLSCSGYSAFLHPERRWLPHSLVQADGKILRMNDAMCQLTGKSDSYHGNISAVFSQLNSAHFPLDSEEREVEIEHAGRRYRVCMKRIPFEELIDDSAVVERISGSCFAVALCLFDITELSVKNPTALRALLAGNTHPGQGWSGIPSP